MNLKNIGKVFTSYFVGTGPSSYKKNLLGRGLTKVEKHCSTPCLMQGGSGLVPDQPFHLGYVVGKLTFGQVLLEILPFSPVRIIL